MAFSRFPEKINKEHPTKREVLSADLGLSPLTVTYCLALGNLLNSDFMEPENWGVIRIDIMCVKCLAYKRVSVMR